MHLQNKGDLMLFSLTISQSQSQGPYSIINPSSIFENVPWKFIFKILRISSKELAFCMSHFILLATSIIPHVLAQSAPQLLNILFINSLSLHFSISSKAILSHFPVFIYLHSRVNLLPPMFYLFKKYIVHSFKKTRYLKRFNRQRIKITFLSTIY